jgi:biotin-(acetyl-CoA carboxylase) ligase
MITPIIHRCDEVGSTNDIALEMARSGAPEGTVVIARSQTKGRGRRGRSWFSKPGESVIMSVILRPDIPVNRYSQLAFPAAVAIAETLQIDCGLDPALKWPNDVLVSDRKIAGILVESVSRDAPAMLRERGDPPDPSTERNPSSRSVSASAAGAAMLRERRNPPALSSQHNPSSRSIAPAAVVGIGVNVRQTNFPPPLADTATSIARENGSNTDIDTLAHAIPERLFAIYALRFEEILDRWQNYMWGLGCRADIETEGGSVSGIIVGIDTDGALLIDQDGKTRRIIAADAINVRNRPSLQSKI